jgi:hypothetical protein
VRRSESDWAGRARVGEAAAGLGRALAWRWAAQSAHPPPTPAPLLLAAQ